MAIGSVMMATSAERMCQRKTRQTKRHHDAFLDELFAQRGDGAFDKLAAVVSR